MFHLLFFAGKSYYYSFFYTQQYSHYFYSTLPNPSNRQSAPIPNNYPTSFPFDGLTFTLCHFFSKGLLSFFFDVTNTSRAVRIKQEGENLAYPIGEQLAFLHIMGAFRTSLELVFLTTRTDFTPSRPLVLFTSRTFTCQEFAASTAIKAAGGYALNIRHYRFHKYQIIELEICTGKSHLNPITKLGDSFNNLLTFLSFFILNIRFKQFTFFHPFFLNPITSPTHIY